MRFLVNQADLTFLDSAARLAGALLISDLRPLQYLPVADGQASWNGEALEAIHGKHFAHLSASISRSIARVCPFQGGAAGFLAYDLNR
ncbi:hypothetical protein [Bradyrhizobium hereditatis]|uniref:hypothetical protein n=1 Tax=Bradyrhizobium hereditatis TaxID=2821405 RepID=UPI001CE2656F